MKTDELSSLLNRALSIRQRLLSLGDRAASALDSNSLEEEDMELCSDIETFPELLQHRANQLIELCTTDPRTFAKPRSGVSPEEQYKAFSQSIVRELRRNIVAAEQVLNRAQAHLPEILSKVHPVSLPLPLSRIWRDWGAEQPEGCGEESPEIVPKEKKGNSVECRYFLSYGGKKMKNPIFQVVFNDKKMNIQLNAPYPGRDLCQALDSLLVLNEGCRMCSLRECLATNIEEYTVRIRDGTLKAQKKPDKSQAPRPLHSGQNELTCYKGSNKYE